MPSPLRFRSTQRSAHEFAERLQARDDTLVSNDPCPYPPDHRFLLNLEDLERGRIRMRHYAGPTQATSPILQIDLAQQQAGLTITCQLLDSNAEFSPSAAAELQRREREDRADDNVDLILDAANFDLLEVAFNLVSRPVRWLFHRAVALLQFLSHRRGTREYEKRLLAVIRDVAKQAPAGRGE